MKSRIVVGMDISDQDICYNVLDKPRKYANMGGHLDVKILGFYPYEEFEDDIGGENGSFVAIYEYDGMNIPVDTLARALDAYGIVFGLIWCSDGVMNPVEDEVVENFPEEIPLSLHSGFYLPVDFYEECCGFYYMDPASDTQEYCAQDKDKFKARIYEELWVKENPDITTPIIEGLPPRWEGVQDLIMNIKRDL